MFVITLRQHECTSFLNLVYFFQTYARNLNLVFLTGICFHLSSIAYMKLQPYDALEI